MKKLVALILVLACVLVSTPYLELQAKTDNTTLKLSIEPYSGNTHYVACENYISLLAQTNNREIYQNIKQKMRICTVITH